MSVAFLTLENMTSLINKLLLLEEMCSLNDECFLVADRDSGWPVREDRDQCWSAEKHESPNRQRTGGSKCVCIVGCSSCNFHLNISWITQVIGFIENDLSVCPTWNLMLVIHSVHPFWNLISNIPWDWHVRFGWQLIQ